MNGWRRNLWILVFSQFIVTSAMTMIIPFLPLYLRELGTDPATVSVWAGLIFGANFLTAFLFSPFWGRVADKYGRKAMILRSGFGMALVVGLTGFATGALSLLILRLLNGVISGFIPASIGLVSTNTPKEKVGYALGILQTGAVSGGILGPLIGGVLAQKFGYSMIFFITGLAIFVAALVVLFFVKEQFIPPEKEEMKAKTIQDFKRVTKHKPILSLCVVIFLLQFAIMGINPLLSIFVEELTSMEAAAFYAGLAISVLGVANILTSPYLGKLSDRKGAHNVLIYSMLGVAMFTIPQAFVTDIWQLIGLRFLVGLCLGGLLPAANTLIRLHAPSGMESRTYGFSTSAMYLGNMIGPILGGLVVATAGIRGLFLISALVLLMTVLIIKLKVIPPASKVFTAEKRKQATKKVVSH